MLITARRIAVVGAVLLLGGCSGSDAITSSKVTSAASLSTEAGASAREVAHAFGLAMSSPEVRADVRNAMRASRMTEHKLVLQEFVTTPVGQRVVRVAAEAAHQSPDEFARRIAQLPSLDFYMPFREHRTTWRGTREVLVGAVQDKQDRRLVAYGTDGSRVVLDASAGVPSRALLVLTPSERKSLRIDPQPDRPGAVIQEPGDGEMSGTLEWVGSDGRRHLVPLASRSVRTTGTARATLMGEGACGGGIDVDTPCLDQGGGLPAGADTTFLDYLETNYTDGAFDPTCELELRTTFYQNGQVVAHATLRHEGIYSGRGYSYHSPLIAREIRPGTDDKLRVNVVETDLIDDDSKGSRDFFEADRGLARTVVHDGFGIPDNETTLRLFWFL